jgi:hypothetical protein
MELGDGLGRVEIVGQRLQHRGAGADGLTPPQAPRHLRSVAVASSALAAVQSIGLA